MTARGLAALLLPVLLSLPARAAQDELADLKPLLGTWLVSKDCGKDKAKQDLLVTFARRDKSVHMEYRDPNKPEILGTADVFGRGIEDHFQVRVALTDNPVLKSLGLDSLPANLVVGDDPDDPDSPGKDYLTCSTNIVGLRAMTTVKLRRGFKKASFIFTDETPNGKDRCRGVGYKQKPEKKPS